MSSTARPCEPLPPLLGTDEPPPYAIVNPEGSSRLLVTCDHACNRVPRALGSLGLTAAQLDLHVAWDPGALVMAKRIAERLDATLIHSTYSRLVIDLNRPLGNPASIPPESEVVQIPGNATVSEAEAQRRADALFWPYHEALAKLLDDRLGRGIVPVYLAIHSFTPTYFGEDRFVEVCVSWWKDDRLARLVHPGLDALGDWQVAIHDPFLITNLLDFGIPQQAERRGLPNMMVELRQDLIRADADAAAWGDRIADVLGPVLDHPGVASTLDPPPDLPRFGYMPKPRTG